MIAVVSYLQLIQCLFFCIAIRLAQLLYTFTKVVEKFILRHTTNAYIALIHGYVHKIIEVAEHAYLAKLCYTSNESKTYITILRLQY